MHAMTEVAVGGLDPAQAAALSLLVELEAQWENMRKHRPRTQEAGVVPPTLAGIQQAYDAFRNKLAAYNKRYTPAHVPEVLLNTPSRLAVWCRTMRSLYLAVEHNPQVRCPVHLVEKAYRSADRISARLHKDVLSRSEPPGTIQAASEALGALVQWCEDLAGAAASA
jgi:hypothetical protein